MSTELLRLIESKLSRLKSEHESRMLFLGKEPLAKLNPNRRASLEEAVNAYVEAADAELKNYAGLVRQEVLDLAGKLFQPLMEDAVESIMSVAKRQFEPDFYPARFKLFEEALTRRGNGFGVRVDEWGMRYDLASSLHKVGSYNLIQRSLSALRDDLEFERLQFRSSNARETSKPESRLEQANRLVKLEPNIFGIGVNLNYLVRRWLGKKE